MLPGNSKADQDKAPLPATVQTWLGMSPSEDLAYQQGDSQTCVYTSFVKNATELGNLFHHMY